MKIYISLVRFSCALAKLPDVENTQFHAGFLDGMRRILEPIAIDLALIIRLLHSQVALGNGMSCIFISAQLWRIKLTYIF